MIHHLARAFAVRQQLGLASTLAEPGHPARPSAPAPVRPRPITPWGSPARPSAAGQPTRANTHMAASMAAHTAPHATPRLRISADPHDARRTVIAGRFAEVCAALDRMVMEQEAIA
ncbi:hypothetical protein [Aquabacterium sp.]|uniref:hypothetical protein n=1 Tax=Aquabacterium sp. TaxID=1872578 RepID=UPI001E0D2ABE|nr:hypothetical protein [Aquabacterium sp.]MBT9608559.1 hypothetical protein [Aquabacterium sp.]